MAKVGDSVSWETVTGMKQGIVLKTRETEDYGTDYLVQINDKVVWVNERSVKHI